MKLFVRNELLGVSLAAVALFVLFGATGLSFGVLWLAVYALLVVSFVHRRLKARSNPDSPKS